MKGFLRLMTLANLSSLNTGVENQSVCFVATDENLRRVMNWVFVLRRIKLRIVNVTGGIIPAVTWIIPPYAWIFPLTIGTQLTVINLFFMLEFLFFHFFDGL